MSFVVGELVTIRTSTPRFGRIHQGRLVTLESAGRQEVRVPDVALLTGLERLDVLDHEVLDVVVAVVAGPMLQDLELRAATLGRVDLEGIAGRWRWHLLPRDGLPVLGEALVSLGRGGTFDAHVRVAPRGLLFAITSTFLPLPPIRYSSAMFMPPMTACFPSTIRYFSCQR
jgi:hypothetical protein